MKKDILQEINLIHKMMVYDRGKTSSENSQLFEQIIGTPPTDGGGTSTGGGGGNRGGGSRGTSAPPKPIPTELKDTEGVKKFQDWLDKNKAGWAYGYSDGKVSGGKGHGRFGPRTQKGWDLHKDEYLKTGTYSNPYAQFKADEVEGSGQAYSQFKPEGGSQNVEGGETSPSAENPVVTEVPKTPAPTPEPTKSTDVAPASTGVEGN